MNMDIAVFSCLGLGDCLLSLILSNNLVKQGYKVTTFHPFMSQVQSWFPHLLIRPFPPKLEQFDRYFIFLERSEWMKEIMDECLTKYRSRTTILNPIATPNTDYPFWEEGHFDGRKPFADNLEAFCRDRLGFEPATKSNGIVIPPQIQIKKYPKRVIIHPTSSRPNKNWSRHKFLTVAKKLKAEGFDPVFTVGPHERGEWPEAPHFDSLSDLFAFVAESGAMIGNDSGIGHLASCFGLPTLTLCRNVRTADFWRPSWAPNAVCLPNPLLPNIKGLRLRDHHWQIGISTSRVLRSFYHLVKR